MSTATATTKAPAKKKSTNKKPTKGSTAPTSDGKDIISDSRGKFARYLEPWIMPIHETREHDSNARDHTDRNVSLIASSLDEFAQVLPVVRDSKGMIYGGNATRRAALSLSWTHIAAAWPGTDDPTRLRALALSLNRTSEFAFWNESMLAESLKDLRHEGMDLTKIGWLDSEFASICAHVDGSVPPSEFPDVTQQETSSKCPKCGYEWR